MMPKVLVTNTIHPPIGVQLLKERYNVIAPPDQTAFTRAEILSNINGVDAVYWSHHGTPLDKEILNAAGCNLKAIATVSAGYDTIDVEELKKRGIQFSNTPGVLNDAVADTAVFLMMATTMGLKERQQEVNSGVWGMQNRDYLRSDIRGATVGIVGLGGIGQEIVKRLQSFRVGTFLYTGHSEKPIGKKLGAKFVTFDSLLNKSDFVVVSCPLTNETKGMFNSSAFNKMKSSAILVNIARGAVVDQDALIAALKSKTIYGAGLDVMYPEPLPKDNELLKLPNAVLLPHIASATWKTRSDMSELAAKNIINALSGQAMITPVL